MKIGIDIDGVLYPWAEAANRALMFQFGIEDPGPHQGWDWLKGQITRQQWDWLWSEDGQEASFGQVDAVYPGVEEAFGALLNSGHECHFVTHRDPTRTAMNTADFLVRHFGQYRWAGLHVMRPGTPKHTLAEWDVFIDDKPDTVLDMLLFTRAVVFAPRRPWNTELDARARPFRRFAHYHHPAEVAVWVLSQ